MTDTIADPLQSITLQGTLRSVCPSVRQCAVGIFLLVSLVFGVLPVLVIDKVILFVF